MISVNYLFAAFFTAAIFIQLVQRRGGRMSATDTLLLAAVAAALWPLVLLVMAVYWMLAVAGRRASS